MFRAHSEDVFVQSGKIGIGFDRTKHTSHNPGLCSRRTPTTFVAGMVFSAKYGANSSMPRSPTFRYRTFTVITADTRR